MMAKLLTAGLISAALAGGAVYFGADAAGLGPTDRADVAETRKADNDPAQAETPPQNRESTTSILDRLLKKDEVREDKVADEVETPDLVPDIEAVEDDDIDLRTPEVTLTEDDPNEDEGDSRITVADMDDEERVDESAMTDERVDLPETVDIPEAEDVDEPTRSVFAADPDERFDILMEEADRITIVDGRDDAYLNILNAALAVQDFDRAEDIVRDLSTPELRDTARQRIGIAHARMGRMSSAFDVIEDLEIEELSDPIRLEIIRAATQPLAAPER